MRKTVFAPRFAYDRSQILKNGLADFSSHQINLLGLSSDARIDALVAQMIESLRRVEYARRLRTTDLCEQRTDPASTLFDPLRAAVLKQQQGDLDEAIWLVFLATHFGKHLRDGWRLVRDIYRGDGNLWTFAQISNNPVAFANWLASEYEALKSDGIKRRFGNHRKYETLRPASSRGTSAVLGSYVKWVGANRRHEGLLADAIAEIGQDQKALFAYLYISMGDVLSFGRTARFDFLTMVGKLGLADIEPDKPYLVGATGPLAGARLLFCGNKNGNLSAEALDAKVVMLGDHLGLGMQVMEDSLCNWQKSPEKFVPFRG